MLPTDFPWNLKHLQPKEMKSTLNKSYLHSSIFIGIWRSAPELWANHREKSSTLMDCCFEKKHFQKKLYKIRKSYFDTKNWSLKSGALTLGHPFIKYSHLYFFFLASSFDYLTVKLQESVPRFATLQIFCLTLHMYEIRKYLTSSFVHFPTNLVLWRICNEN